MLGSSFRRAVTGQAALVPTIVAMAVLVALHRVLALISHRWGGVSRLLKGEPISLVREGRLCRDAMRRTHIEESDLAEAFRLQGELRNAESVRVAYLERNGRISVIPMNGSGATPNRD